MEIPLYLVNGFLESGKTTFIKETIKDPEFSKKYKTLLIICEEGEEEYEETELKKLNINLISVENEEELNEEFLNKCEKIYEPHRIMIEFNGMWKTNEFSKVKLPDNWIMVQVITIINAITYNNYLSNMRSIILEQLKYSDTIIFNRCNESTNKIELRRSVKPVNRKGQIIYESADNVIQDTGEDELPYDLEADVIEICDDDYGIWYMDAMDNPKKYNGKVVKFTAMVYLSEKLPRNSFVPGRFAMTCCADDIAFMGMPCKVDSENIGTLNLKDLINKQYINITAKIRSEFYKEYKGKGPVLYAQKMESVREPEEPIIYFN